MDKEYDNYFLFEDHNGSKNFEVLTIIPNQFTINELLIIHNSQTISIVYNDTIKKVIRRLKVNFSGEILGKEIGGITLTDGTILGENYYSNWLINDDNTQHKFINPFGGQKITNINKVQTVASNEAWLHEFDFLYDTTKIVYVDGCNYYFKADDKWYFIKYTAEKTKNIDFDFKEKYKPKGLSDTANATPFNDCYKNLIREGQIESKYTINREKNHFAEHIGEYLIDFITNNGETLHFKHLCFDQEQPFKLFKIPAYFGKKDEVYFIQPTAQNITNTAGLYIIKPK